MAEEGARGAWVQRGILADQVSLEVLVRPLDARRPIEPYNVELACTRADPPGAAPDEAEAARLAMAGHIRGVREPAIHEDESAWGSVPRCPPRRRPSGETAGGSTRR